VPVLLGAILAHWGQRGPAEISAKRLHTYRLSVFLGERHGLDIRFPPRHPFNPLKALRLLAGANADLQMVRAAFDFVFRRDARRIRTRNSPPCAALGVPLLLASDDDSQGGTRANTDRAIEQGVFGVPSFVADTPSGHEVFWGVDAFDMLLAWLETPDCSSASPIRHLDDVSHRDRAQIETALTPETSRSLNACICRRNSPKPTRM
jgi:2-hydroxychromene-2-carboxylate isomerase